MTRYAIIIGEGSMETKEKVLSYLEAHKGEFVCGDDIAMDLGLTHSGVWKTMQELKIEGHEIVALRKKGYCLLTNPDSLSSVGIHKYLNDDTRDLRIDVFPKLISTNNYARSKAYSGEDEGYVVLAKAQTGGKGRRGRSFFSPSDSGLYMSLLLRPQLAPNETVKLTAVAAVAVCEAIEALSDDKASIKWVNDIFVDGKKVCGILTESSFLNGSDKMDYAIVGIGINVTEPSNGFPNEIKDIAGHVNLTDTGGKNKLAAEILNRFMNYYKNNIDCTEKYRERNFAIGKNVAVITATDTKKAVVVGVDDDYRLIVQYDNGINDHLYSGEISIKIKD